MKKLIHIFIKLTHIIIQVLMTKNSFIINSKKTHKQFKLYYTKRFNIKQKLFIR